MLLKANDFGKNLTKGETFSFRDIAVEARQIMESAHRERDRMIATAQAGIEQARKEATERGYRKGYDEGIAAGREEGSSAALAEARKEFSQNGNSALACLKEAMEQLDQQKQQVLWQAEQSLVRLSIGIASQIVKRVAAEDSDVTGANVKAALEMVARGSDVVVKVNPGDISYLESMLADDKDVLGKYNNIKIEQDMKIANGGCVLLAGHGQIDAQLDTQISHIARELLMSKDDTGTKDKS
jgi:flagellar assembly protein FliH